ncbi:hypothetical protein ACQZV8_02960 [Magnetococcales bacterium HHB-1]
MSNSQSSPEPSQPNFDPGRILGEPVIKRLPSLLSQIDRRPHAPTYGSCCRNHWHYRIEDISNSQLQELVLILASAYRLKKTWNPYAGSPVLLRWIDAVLIFWTTLQRPHGAFDEVYQGHDSYAATAFSTFCATEALLMLEDQLNSTTRKKVTDTACKASIWLHQQQESFAYNQVAGAATAIYNTFMLTKDQQFKKLSEEVIDSLLKHQHSEGWFPEYGGADIGYSSLTFDYLVRYSDKSGHQKAFQSALKLLNFLEPFLFSDGSTGGVIGSRNTEYFIPYGLESLARNHEKALTISNRLLSGLQRFPNRHVIPRLDDRYAAYLGGFYLQAALISPKRSTPALSPPQQDVFYPASGLWSLSTETLHLVANLRKGGVLRCTFHDQTNFFVDAGIYLHTSDKHVLSAQVLDMASEKAEHQSAQGVAHCDFSRVRPIIATPWNLIIFRATNLLLPKPLRRWLLDRVRQRAVAKGKTEASLQRKLRVKENQLIIEDTITFYRGDLRLRYADGNELTFSFASCGFFYPGEITSPSRLHPILQIHKPGTLRIIRTLTPSGWNAPEISPPLSSSSGDSHEFYDLITEDH